MVQSFLSKSIRFTAAIAALLCLSRFETSCAAPYASSASPAQVAAARRYASARGTAATARSGASQPSWNYIGKSQIPVATRPSMQIPVASRPQSQIPYRKTPGLSVATPPMMKTQNYEPATLPGFYPVLRTVQAAARQQAMRGDPRKPDYRRVNLHPERAWQSSTTGTAMTFRRRVVAPR